MAVHPSLVVFHRSPAVRHRLLCPELHVVGVVQSSNPRKLGLSLCLLALQSGFLALFFKQTTCMALSSLLHLLGPALSETGTAPAGRLPYCRPAHLPQRDCFYLESAACPPSLLLRTNQPQEPGSSSLCLFLGCVTAGVHASLWGACLGAADMGCRFTPPPLALLLGCCPGSQVFPLGGGAMLVHSLQEGTMSDLSPL